jgi:hypothetical protein
MEHVGLVVEEAAVIPEGQDPNAGWMGLLATRTM